MLLIVALSKQAGIPISNVLGKAIVMKMGGRFEFEGRIGSVRFKRSNHILPRT